MSALLPADVQPVLDAVASILRAQDEELRRYIDRQVETAEAKAADVRRELLAALGKLSNESAEQAKRLRSGVVANADAISQVSSRPAGVSESSLATVREELRELSERASAAEERAAAALAELTAKVERETLSLSESVVSVGERVEVVACRAQSFAEEARVETQALSSQLTGTAENNARALASVSGGVEELEDRVTVALASFEGVEATLGAQDAALDEVREELANVAASAGLAKAAADSAAQDARGASERTAAAVAEAVEPLAARVEAEERASELFEEKLSAQAELARVASMVVEEVRGAVGEVREVAERAVIEAAGYADRGEERVKALSAHLVAQDEENGRRVAERVDEAEDRIRGHLDTLVCEAVSERAADLDLRAARVEALAAQLDRDFERDSASIAALKPIDGRRTFSRGAYGRAGASLFRCRVQETKSTPAEDEGAWELVAAGIDDIRVEVEEGRVVMYALLAGHDSRLADFRIPHHRGGYRKGETYHELNLTTRRGSTWMCCVDETATEPGSEAGRGSWRLVSQRGPEGERGERGSKGERGLPGGRGEDGVGLADVVRTNGNELSFVLTSGEMKRFEL